MSSSTPSAYLFGQLDIFAQPGSRLESDTGSRLVPGDFPSFNVFDNTNNFTSNTPLPMTTTLPLIQPMDLARYTEPYRSQLYTESHDRDHVFQSPPRGGTGHEYDLPPHQPHHQPHQHHHHSHSYPHYQAAHMRSESTYSSPGFSSPHKGSIDSGMAFVTPPPNILKLSSREPPSTWPGAGYRDSHVRSDSVSEFGSCNGAVLGGSGGVGVHVGPGGGSETVLGTPFSYTPAQSYCQDLADDYFAPHYQYHQHQYGNDPGCMSPEEKRRSKDMNKARKHICPVCDKRFNRPSSLNTHMSVHTGAKPYQCLRENCGRRFSVSSNLRRHERTHDPQRVRPTKQDSGYSVRSDSVPQYAPGLFPPPNYGAYPYVGSNSGSGEYQHHISPSATGLDLDNSRTASSDNSNVSQSFDHVMASDTLSSLREYAIVGRRDSLNYSPYHPDPEHQQRRHQKDSDSPLSTQSLLMPRPIKVNSLMLS